MRSGMGGSQSKGLGHKRGAHTGNESVQRGYPVASAPISYHATCYSYRWWREIAFGNILPLNGTEASGCYSRRPLDGSEIFKGWSNLTWNVGARIMSAHREYSHRMYLLLSLLFVPSNTVTKTWPPSYVREVKTRTAKFCCLYILTDKCYTVFHTFWFISHIKYELSGR